ncbi:MAG TPA: biotin/lipoyl-containing protein [Thermoplasmata archaeon]|nr:biotin/lipoyl-containing protein [Thermoplasmata archaeon]
MRVRVARDGKVEEIDVDLAGATVELGGARHPFVVVASSPMKVELEIAGERIVVEQWPEGMPIPPGPVDVNGERWTLSRVETSDPRPAARAAAPPPPAPAPPAAAEGPGVPILPPMPGKTIEVRVQNGDHVTKGQILLILEAMKMRNEISSPTAGRVERLQVRPGSSVRAREPMLFVVPD